MPEGSSAKLDARRLLSKTRCQKAPQ